MVTKTHPAKIQSGGRVSIEKSVRDEFDLEQGDYVLVTVEPMEETQ